METLEEIGTPWAEEYRGSGRLTGQLAPEPTLTDRGLVAPGWWWLGDWTLPEFELSVAREQALVCGPPAASYAGWTDAD